MLKSRVAILLALLLAGSSLALAAVGPVSLSLASGSAPAGGTISLSLSLASATIQPAGLQWSFVYSPSDFTAIDVVAGPSATSASKALVCTGANGTATCLLYGVNANTIANGAIATATLTLSSSANLSRPIQISNAGASSLLGDSIATAASGGVVTVPTSLPVGVSSVTCSPTSVTGNGSSICTVTLNVSAPTAGAVVALSDNSSFVTTPASVTVAAGASTASFAASVSGVTTDSTAVITASLNGTTASASLSLGAPVVPSTLSCSPATISSAAATTCAVTLNKPAPTAGQLVSLSDNNAVLTVPASVTIAAGSTAATFSATAGTVSVATVVSITATANGASTTAAVSLTVAPPRISGLTCSSASLTGAGTSTCTVTLDVAAPGGGISVAVSSNNASLTVASPIIVSAGASSSSFTATAAGVAADQAVTLTATYGSTFKTTSISLVALAQVSSLNCTPTSVLSRGTSTCTVTLSKAAPAGGSLLSMSVNNSNLAIPASLAISAGATSGTFTAAAGTISTAQTATVTVALNGSSKTFAVSLAPTQPNTAVGISSLGCAPASIIGPASASCTITLTDAAPAGGTVIALSDDSASLATPASMTISAGSTTASFTVTASSVVSSTTVTVTAAANGTSASAPITITAAKTVTYSISGVISANGSPVGGVAVALGGPQTRNATTAADGTYSFQGLPSGDYSVTPTRTNVVFSPSTVAVKLAGDQTVNFTVSSFKSSLSVNRSALRFGATAGGAAITAEQEIIISVTDSLPVSWTVVSDKPWIKTTPSAGAGPGRLSVWLVPGSLPSPGVATASLTVSSSDATSAPVTVQVVLAVSSATGAPFGSFDTPVNGTTGLGSSFAVTGWALDDVGVKKLQIWRERVGVEPVYPNGMVFIGDAVFVPNARPDVEALYPNQPASYRAGWGYMMLSNFLPNPNGGPSGNGTYKLHAIATDAEGREADLGVKTVTVDNAHSTKPLGAIDAPGQGATISGSAYINDGWALTPQPNKISNNAGSGIQVYVDGVPVGSATYGQYRSDIATLFPSYANAAGAGGSYPLDTTKYANGMHSIVWLVTDDGGRADGIGSRFFSILNTSSTVVSFSEVEEVDGKQQLLRSARRNTRLLEKPSTASYCRGFNADNPLFAIPSGGAGLFRPIEVDELERVEIHLPAAPGGVRWTGGIRVNGELRPLPAGSTFDEEDGVFYWQLGPGFLGEYQLEFRWESDLQPSVEAVIPVRVRSRDGVLPGGQQ